MQDVFRHCLELASDVCFTHRNVLLQSHARWRTRDFAQVACHGSEPASADARTGCRVRLLHRVASFSAANLMPLRSSDSTESNDRRSSGTRACVSSTARARLDPSTSGVRWRRTFAAGFRHRTGLCRSAWSVSGQAPQPTSRKPPSISAQAMPPSRARPSNPRAASSSRSPRRVGSVLMGGLPMGLVPALNSRRCRSVRDPYHGSSRWCRRRSAGSAGNRHGAAAVRFPLAG